jgi:ADP-heptose:LPS heptosyltransferase
LRTDSILVIPFADGIGDFVNVQPLLAALRQKFPQAAMHVASSGHGNYLVNDPDIRVVSPKTLDHTPTPWQIKLRRFLPQTVLAWCAGPVLDLELGPFDLVINLFYAWERAMDFRRTWTPQLPAQPNVVHTIDCLAEELERELNIRLPLAERKPTLVLRPAAREQAAQFWGERQLGATGPVVALVPVSNMIIKRWPADRWLALDHQLREAHPGLQTLLFCDSPVEENSMARRFAAAGSPALPIYQPLDDVAALLARCDLVIGVDTGLLHIAAALDTPWLGLFGPTNPVATGPYDTSRGQALVAPYRKPRSCGSCWKHFKYEDDHCRTLTTADSCMSKLAVEPVTQAALRLLVYPVPGYLPRVAPLVRRAPSAVPVELGAGLFQHS